MSKSVYYTRPNGRQPATVFRDKQPRYVQVDIDAKIEKLERYGVDTLINSPEVRFLGPKALYELRNRVLGWRLAFYYVREDDRYVFLNGWKKQKRTQPNDVEQARLLAREYVSRRRTK